MTWFALGCFVGGVLFVFLNLLAIIPKKNRARNGE